jgi:hypothetical protein
MNHIELMDASLICMAVNKASSIKEDNVIFGGKYKFTQRIKRKISRSDWISSRNLPILLRGGRSDTNGNRKAELNIIDDNSILLKFNKNTHIRVQLPKLSKEHKKHLYILQSLCESNKTGFSLEVSHDSISVIFDDNILKESRSNIINDRILSFDMNPNFIGVSIIEWKSELDNKIIHKEIISIKNINDLTHNGYMTNKRKHETMHISKYITTLALHYKCQVVAFEQLSLSTSDKGKGSKYNRLVNNYWIRTAFISNIKKRCNMSDISFQEIVPQYSSFIGQLNNPNDYDSVAASIEISRRAFLYRKMYVDKTMNPGNIIFPVFNIGQLILRWKDRLGDIPNNIESWKSLYNWIKKSKSSYRFLFSPISEKLFELYSRNSYINRYIIT